jgi:hypothetical protein
MFWTSAPVFPGGDAVAFTVFMGFAYRSGNQAEEDPRLKLGWTNQDPDGAISSKLYEMLSNSDSVRLVDLQPDTAEKSVRDGDVAGALIIPARFSELVLENKAQLTLIADPASTVGQSIYQTLRSTVMRLMSSVEIGQLSAESSGMQDDPTEINTAFEEAMKAWSEVDSAKLVKVELAVGKKTEEWYGDNPYNQASPGILVQCAIFSLITSGQILVQERKTRTLQRMITTSMPAWQIILGHLLA